jgi:cell division protein FtsL
VANKYRDIPTQTEALEQEQTVVEEIVAEKVQKVTKPRKKGVLAKGLSAVFSGTFLTNEKTLKHLPYVIFLGCVAIFYIANGYYADNKIREVNKLNKDIKESRTEYISTKSDLMFASKQSEVAKSALQLGLKEPLVPPTKILVDSLQLYKTN